MVAPIPKPRIIKRVTSAAARSGTPSPPAIPSLPRVSKRTESINQIEDALSMQFQTQAEAEDFSSQMSGSIAGPTGAIPGIASSYVTVPPETLEQRAEQEDQFAAIKKTFGPTVGNAIQTVTEGGQNLRDNGIQNARKIKTKLASVPIPGGIGVPLILMIVLFMILIPVNAHTRAGWLWLALTGKAQVSPSSSSGSSNQTVTTSTLPTGGINPPEGQVPLVTQGGLKLDVQGRPIASSQTFITPLGSSYADLLSNSSIEF